MDPSPQLRTQTWDDEIDLRQLIETLLQRKWMIAGFIAIAVIVAAVYSFFILPPRYESSIVVALPSASASDSFGMSTQAYEAFALNNGVLSAIIRNGNLDMASHNVENRLKLRLDTNSRLLTVTAGAGTAAEAAQLARLWQQSFQSQLLSHADAFVQSRLQHAEGNWRRADDAARSATAELDEFERQHSLTVKQARLSRWEDEFINSEARLQDLREHVIPNDTARVAFLEDFLTSVPSTLEGANGAAVVDIDGAVGVTTRERTTLNPVYLELAQDLSRTRTRLSANEQAARLLQVRLDELPAQIDALREDVVNLRTERSRLTEEVLTAERHYNDMRRTYQELATTYGDIGQLTALTVVADPVHPSGPVAPRKLLNVALAAFLGAFVGIGLAFFQQFWNGHSEPA